MFITSRELLLPKRVAARLESTTNLILSVAHLGGVVALNCTEVPLWFALSRKFSKI